MPMPQPEVVREGTKPTPIVAKERPKQVDHDETPSGITDHKYSSRGEWWDLCHICGLAEAAHAESELHYVGDDMTDD